MSWFIIAKNIQIMRKVLHDEDEENIYLANNFIIDTCKKCFQVILENNHYQKKQNRKYFDIKAQWDLIRECRLEEVVENISNWLKEVANQWNGKCWMEVKASEIVNDCDGAINYNNGFITSDYL